jgi:membrane fusion protein, heavy metal efflux system
MNQSTHAASAAGPPPNLHDDAVSRVRRPGVLVWIERVVPNLLVLAGLAAFAYWGHETGWKLPKFSELSGAAVAKEAKWCDEHNVQECLCVECNPTRYPRPKSFGWCAEHGVMDCPLHHPEVAQLPYPPVVTPADLERARRGLEFSDRPENSTDSKIYERRVQFASDESFEKAGVDVRPARREAVVESVPANGEIVYDETRVARLSARLPGTLWWVGKTVGQRVAKGEVLALVDAAEVGKAKADLLQALAEADLKGKTLERLRPLAGQAVAGSQFLDAEAALREAQIRLATAQHALVNLGLPVQPADLKGMNDEEAARRVQFLGLSDALTKALDPRTTTANLLPVTAPLDGVVVTRQAATGEVVDASKVLFVVADVSRMWATLDLRVEDARLVALGQKVRFRPDGRQGKEDLIGTVAWASTGVDEKTRTVKVRVELANPKGELRDNTFGTGRVILREEKDALVVPTEAVHQVGDCNVVFVRDRDFLKEGALKLFYVREVRPGARSEDGRLTEIVVGLLPGEVVATRGSDVLRAQLMKDQLGGDD